MTDVCGEIEPPLTDYDGHLAACHHPLNVSTQEAQQAGVAAESPVSAPADATPTEPAGRETHPVSAETPRSG
jgi:peptide/nickel transport system ATP-binding protein/oligopeptide transport system ATP-binding protein